MRAAVAAAAAAQPNNILWMPYIKRMCAHSATKCVDYARARLIDWWLYVCIVYYIRVSECSEWETRAEIAIALRSELNWAPCAQRRKCLCEFIVRAHDCVRIHKRILIRETETMMTTTRRAQHKNHAHNVQSRRKIKHNNSCAQPKTEELQPKKNARTPSADHV